MPIENDAVEDERTGFPWGSAVLLLAVLWVSLWAAGAAGGFVGVYVYDDKYVPEPPYSEAELAMVERMAPETFKIATLDMEAWEASVELGRTIARLEGKVIGSMLLLGVWGSVGVAWLWNRQRAQRAQFRFSADYS